MTTKDRLDYIEKKLESFDERLTNAANRAAKALMIAERVDRSLPEEGADPVWTKEDKQHVVQLCDQMNKALLLVNDKTNVLKDGLQELARLAQEDTKETRSAIASLTGLVVGGLASQVEDSELKTVLEKIPVLLAAHEEGATDDTADQLRELRDQLANIKIKDND